MIKTLTSASTLALALVASPLAAQDAATFDGFYVGGAVGLDSIDNGANGLEFDTDRNGTFGDTVLTSGGSNAFGPGFCRGDALDNNVDAGCDGDDEDIGYAIRAGIDGRMGSFVAGLLVEGSMSDAVDYTTGFSTTPASYTYARTVDKMIAARGRLGISPGDGRGLFYATGGVAYADIDRAFTTSNTANSFALNEDGDDMEWGFQGGAGVEFMVAGGFSLGAEYLYTRFDDDNAFVEVGPGTAGATNPFLLVSGGTNLRPVERDIELHSLRLTAALRF